MLDHIQFDVRDIKRSKDFYLKSLEPLGYRVFKDLGCVIGLQGKGCPGPDLWMKEPIPGAGPIENPLHVAFYARSRGQVRAFYEAALAAGGTDNGAPGLRKMYHPMYYGAFVKDPDGNNVEVCNHFDWWELLLELLRLKSSPPDLSSKPKFL